MSNEPKRNHGPGPRLYAEGDRIPQGDQERKDAPMYRGLLGYFPAALFEVAAHSLESDRKHNPGNAQGPNWARGKSADHADCIIRHLIDAGAAPARRDDPAAATVGERKYHLTAIAWRALALLQEHCEGEGATPGVSSVFPSTVEKIRERVAAAREDRLEFPQLAHPAQRLAVDAFRREQARPVGVVVHDPTGNYGKGSMVWTHGVGLSPEPNVELGGAGE
jgi:hypothetical protein